MSIREVLFFAERLESMGMKPDAVVINRVPQDPGEAVSSEVLCGALEQAGIPTDGELPARMLEAAAQQRKVAKMARLHMLALEEFSSHDGMPVVEVVEFAREIHDVERLVWVADRLTG
jgi:hypothetical protein